MRIWTISRATGTGVVAGLAALMLWPIFAAYQEPVRLAYMLALAITAFCGLSVLAMSGTDMLLRRRGRKIRPVRAFDLAMGVLLTAPALSVLYALLR